MDDPVFFRIRARDALAGFRILHIFKPVPDQSANIEFVVENAGAPLPVAVNSGRPPALARWTGYAFGVELFGDSAR